MTLTISNFVKGFPKFLLTGTDDQGNTCLYDFVLELPTCVQDTTPMRPAVVLDEIYKEPVLVLSPNPTQDTVSIQYSGYESDVELNVFDLTGRLMSTEQLLIKSNNLLLNVASYPTGIYIVVIKQSEQLLSQYKLVKN